MRNSPLWQNFMRQLGYDTSRHANIKLSDQQQKQLEQQLARSGMQIPGGMHIDPAGNLNQKNRLLRNIGIGAAIGGGALTGLGLAGMGPLSGLGGGAAASGGGAAASGVLPSSSLPVASLMGGAPAIASQGVSAGLGAGMGAGAAGAMGAAAGGAGSALGGAASGGGSLLGKVLTGLKDYGPLALAGAGAVKGLTQGPPQAEQQLNEILKMAQGRMQASEPLFQALNAMAMSQMPDYTKNRG
jgi:hypothetical protein